MPTGEGTVNPEHTAVRLLSCTCLSLQYNDSEDRDGDIVATATLSQRSGFSLTIAAAVITARAVKRSVACRLDVAFLPAGRPCGLRDSSTKALEKLALRRYIPVLTNAKPGMMEIY